VAPAHGGSNPLVLTESQRLKFELLARGVQITQPATDVLATLNNGRPLTPADYASTSGVILRLDDHVWVNAPVSVRNADLVATTPFVLDVDSDGFVVAGKGLSSRASFWLPPDYHGQIGLHDRPLNHFVFTHSDRVRLSPIMGCAMTCKFCNIPYEDRYGVKPIDAMVHALRVALSDPSQPAQHVLISGGTPKSADVGFLQEVYRVVLRDFSDIDVDIMMVPVDGLFDLGELRELGVHQLSINLEVFSDDIAKSVMRQKFQQGRQYYLDFIERATAVLGAGSVRSMLMVGIEPASETLAGVEAIIERGGIPVLSPFRPDPATPMRDAVPPSAALLEEVFLAASAAAFKAGVRLGPDCPPCTHNTLTLADPTQCAYPHAAPTMV
jgi:hypothetical protein